MSHGCTRTADFFLFEKLRVQSDDDALSIDAHKKVKVYKFKKQKIHKNM
jgi:hypothetical protein